jgi:hypothetical protein
MDGRLYTIHTHPRRDGLEVVGETGWLSVIPPLWALYEGLWVNLAVQIAALAAVGAFAPLGLGTLYLALVLITAFDGATLQRLELRLLGWREAACVEAGTPEGAEELFLTGRAEAERTA